MTCTASSGVELSLPDPVRSQRRPCASTTSCGPNGRALKIDDKIDDFTFSPVFHLHMSTHILLPRSTFIVTFWCCTVLCNPGLKPQWDGKPPISPRMWAAADIQAVPASGCLCLLIDFGYPGTPRSLSHISLRQATAPDHAQPNDISQHVRNATSTAMPVIIIRHGNMAARYVHLFHVHHLYLACHRIITLDFRSMRTTGCVITSGEGFPPSMFTFLVYQHLTLCLQRPHLLSSFILRRFLSSFLYSCIR